MGKLYKTKKTGNKKCFELIAETSVKYEKLKIYLNGSSKEARSVCIYSKLE